MGGGSVSAEPLGCASGVVGGMGRNRALGSYQNTDPLSSGIFPSASSTLGIQWMLDICV